MDAEGRRERTRKKEKVDTLKERERERKKERERERNKNSYQKPLTRAGTRQANNTDSKHVSSVARDNLV